MNKRTLVGLSAGTSAIALAITLSIAPAANAATSNLGSHSCSGGTYIHSHSLTTGDTSHNIWTSASNNQGQWWPGDSAWRSRSFTSTKTSANSVYITYTSLSSAGKGCYVPW